MSDEQALRALIGRIEETFGRDLHAWLTCFARPVVFITPVATLTLADDEAAEAQFAPMFADLAARGFASTRADDVVVRRIGDDLALVDAAFTRWHEDGSAIERVGALYVCRRSGAGTGWMVAALVSHPAEVDALPR